MVPSRSRNTAGRRTRSDTFHRCGGEPGIDGSFDFSGRDMRHAALIDRAAAQETRAAIWLLPDDGAARSYRRGAQWIGGAKDSDGGKADGGGDVHGAGIVADKDVALRKERGKIRDGGLAGEIDGRLAHFGGDRGGNRRFACGAEEYHVGVPLRLQAIGELGKAHGRPAFCGPVGGTCADRDSEGVWAGAGAGVDQELSGASAI